MENTYKDNGKPRICYLGNIPKDEYQYWCDLAQKEERSFAGFVRNAIKKYCEYEENERKTMS